MIESVIHQVNLIYRSIQKTDHFSKRYGIHYLFEYNISSKFT